VPKLRISNNRAFTAATALIIATPAVWGGFSKFLGYSPTSIRRAAAYDGFRVNKESLMSAPMVSIGIIA